ncbi:hypothetical protein [Synechococcus sp. PCC 7335]|uniref:hypothetical protein n=1 Tax=Synechococcus sp. (strain ATCC 29403 / PCC 7335) TaxID=91464 RepID=UPI0012F7124E|nr:hypothetical protein [Synechococcus sp. PCC 7335]
MPFSLLFGKSLCWAVDASQSHSVLTKHDNLVLEPAYLHCRLIAQTGRFLTHSPIPIASLLVDGLPVGPTAKLCGGR